MLNYERPIVLVGGGWIDWDLLTALVQQGYVLIAADGAANPLLTRDFVPDAIIGDMDSIEKSGGFPTSVKLFEVTEQDTTDFEKCLYSTNAPHYVGLGFLGARLDHSLAVISTLAKYAAEKSVVIVDEVDLLFVTQGDFQITLPISERISIFPLSDCKFRSSEGLLYPLDGLNLRIGGLVGTSNQTVAESITVQSDHRQDSYAVLFSKSYMSNLIAEFGP